MSQYTFDVDANTKKAEQNVKDLLSLLGRVDKASKNSSKVDNFKNDNKTLELLQDFKRMESTYKDLSKSAQSYEKSPDFSGKTTDFQHLNSELEKTSNILSKVSQGINKLGAGGGGNFKEYTKETEQLKTNLGENAKLIQELQRIKSRYRRIGNQQDRIGSKVTSTGYMSMRDLGTYSRNKSQLQNAQADQDNLNGIIHMKQDQYNQLRNQTISGLNTNGKPMSTDELNDLHSQMSDLSKVLRKARDANTAIDAAQDTSSGSDMALATGLRAIGSKAALPLAIIGAVKKGIEFVAKDVQQGKQINQATGEQALNMGDISGHVSDGEMRGRVQNLMRMNGMGYKTQEGLDYYALAQQTRSYDRNAKRDVFGYRALNMTNALEIGGRSSGVTDNTWKNTASAAVESGAIVSDKSVNRLSEVIAGENIRSKNSGNSESNAKIITDVVQQLTRSGTVNMNGITNVAAVASLLSRSSKMFSGKQGEQNVASFNQGFLNAGSGQDDPLLYMKIQSNPAKYGNPRGYLNAQEDLNKGISSPENIGMVRNYVQMASRSGIQGQALAAIMMEKHFGWSAKTADKISSDMLDDKISPDKIRDEIKHIDKKGNLQVQKNKQNYQNSQQASLNSEQAQREARQSKASGTFKWWTDLKNGFGNFFNSTNVTGSGGVSAVPQYYPSGTSSSNPGAIGSMNPGAVGSTNPSSAVAPSAKTTSSSGGGLFGTTNVHAATLTKKEKEQDRKNRRSHFKAPTSSKTISEKEQTYSRSKAYLNTRNEEKNLRDEKDNISKREEELKEFERLLKEERNQSKSGGFGKAGTVGKSSSSKSKSKSKGNSKSKSNSKSKLKENAKKKPAGSTSKPKKSNKKTTNNSMHNTNNITVNMPATNGTPGAIGGAIGTRLADTITQTMRKLSNDYVQGD